MRRRLPPLNALHAFEAAARLGSFTKAAQELGVAQPAVTRHVANLEAWLDTTLFERRGNSIRLTRAGEAVSDLATATFDRLELGLQDLPRRPEAELVIGASFGIMHIWVMPMLTKIRSAARATVNFVTADDYRALDDGSVDLSIRFGNGTFAGQISEKLLAEGCYVLASPAFLEAHPQLRAGPDPSTLCPDWLLDHGDPHNIGWMTWSRWYAHHGAPRPAGFSLRQVRNYPAMLDMVRHSEGLALGSVGLEDDLVDSGAVLRLGAPISRPGYGYYLVYPAATRDKPGFEGLRRLFLAGSTL